MLVFISLSFFLTISIRQIMWKKTICEDLLGSNHMADIIYERFTIFETETQLITITYDKKPLLVWHS